MKHPTARPTSTVYDDERPSDRYKVNLIKSISSYADHRQPAHLIAEIQAIIDGASLEELVALRDRMEA